MAKYGVIVISAFILFATTAEALKCWRCSSDSQNAAYCSDPFDFTALEDRNKQWAYIDCSAQSNSNNLQGQGGFNQNQNQFNNNGQVVPACRKLKQIVNDKVVVYRQCVLQNINSIGDSCINASNVPSYIKTEFCQTCTTDGCNSGSQYGPIAMLVGLSAAIGVLTKIFV